MGVPFPSTLQQFINQQGFSLSKGPTVIRSSPDTGPVKMRRRFTRSVDRMSVTLYLDLDQFNTFETFYNTTTNAGVTPFDLDHPITGVTREYRFLDEPTYSSIGGVQFQVAFTLEILPL